MKTYFVFWRWSQEAFFEAMPKDDLISFLNEHGSTLRTLTGLPEEADNFPKHSLLILEDKIVVPTVEMVRTWRLS